MRKVAASDFLPFESPSELCICSYYAMVVFLPLIHFLMIGAKTEAYQNKVGGLTADVNEAEFSLWKLILMLIISNNTNLPN